MGNRTIGQCLRVPGQLVWSPTNLATAFPHGGKGLGVVSGTALDMGIMADPLPPDEDRNRIGDVVYLGENWTLAVTLREWADDVKTTLFPNTATGATSEDKGIDASGAALPGELLSARAAPLIFKPDDTTNHPAVLFTSAIPHPITAPLNLALADDLVFVAVFTAIPGTTIKVPAYMYPWADMAALLSAEVDA